MNHDLAGLEALITGGASGIGLATAMLLADHGARTAVLGLDPSGIPQRCSASPRTWPTTPQSVPASTRLSPRWEDWTSWSTMPGSVPRQRRG